MLAILHRVFIILIWLVSSLSYSDVMRQNRFLSQAIRDIALDADEAKVFASEKISITEVLDSWLSAKQHKNRIKRFFNDQFGIGPNIDLLPDTYFLRTQSDGALFLPIKGTCTDIITISDAWWLQSGQTIKVGWRSP